MSYAGFGKESGPSVPPKSQPVFGHTNPFLRPPSSSLATLAAPYATSPSPPRASVGQNVFYGHLGAPAPENLATITTLAASRDSTSGITARVSRSQNPEKIRSLPLPYAGNDASKYPGQTVLRSPSKFLADDRNQLLHLKSQSPPLVPVNYQSVQSFQPSIAVQRPAVASSTLGNQGFVGELNGAQVSKRMRSPPLPLVKSNEVLQDNNTDVQQDLTRSLSPPKLRNASSILRSAPDVQVYKRSSPPTAVSEAPLNRSISSSTPKRTRSPPRLSSTDKTLEGKIISSNDNSEREMLAKAKRLARFKVDLSKSEQNDSNIADRKASASRNEQSLLEQKYVDGHSTQSTVNFTNGLAFSDSDGLKTSNIIIGLCPDMCPESERAERERKGDLDQYERLDGDRNVTSRVLAVKKYNRTAEREANLIRPMPVLQETIDYLLNLLDQRYDERFLGMYNFLWDRMRAIRMDLRMQHIFNQGAITMLEQMIRLHIIAMHELCEFTKGEGFSEGFDAHLNIEQMNKTSVELFQMYDDHRKKGINVPTEKEFRGYYALLKLDKHPGYKVEPAELSLDLAKMTPETRQTPEVLFARKVARACRTGNFIAFFRLARKASYLQACLMHAHFAKLRTQALASLHAGLQNNQGLPVSHVANWLAMEDEDIEGLLEYHGFLVKAFEEPYMVKEGPFLNIDNDYPTKCSKLVHKKRSKMIIEDVAPSDQFVSPPVETTNEIQIHKKYKNEQQSVQEVSSVEKVDEEMPDSVAILSPKDGRSGWKFKEMPIAFQRSETDHNVTMPFASPIGFFHHGIPEPQPTRSVLSKRINSDSMFTSSPKRNLHSELDGRLFESMPKPSPSESSKGFDFHIPVADPLPPSASQDESLLVDQVNEDEIDQAEEIDDQDEEIAAAKLKLFLRLWRRRVSKLRMLREQRQFAANAALDSLSLGPPIQHYVDQPINLDKFDIDKALRERYEKQEKSWARLNLSEMVGDVLSRRNSGVKCLCWKIILCSQTDGGHKMSAAGSWLISKLMPSSDEDMVISSPGLTIWKKWVPGQCGTDPTCCFSVIRDTSFGGADETVSGASAVLFLVSEGIPWKSQRVQLHNLLMSIPTGAHLPLLILCGSYDKGYSPVIISELGLHDIDKSRISSFLLVFLIENQQMEHLDGFFSDRRLREGLEWLAGESSLQPALQYVKVRELVHTHLSSLFRVLDSTDNSRLGPNDCILVFNEALDRSLQDIVAAANENPAGWPCPEIGVLDQSSDEDRLLKSYLPPSGWSSLPKLEQIIRAFQDCKLPRFPDDLSWLALGSKSKHEIENDKLRLEGSLIQYLTDISKMMGVPLATKEAHVMLQSCARLKLCGSSYHIVPQWTMIFYRIFNWRLMSLSSGEVSFAYISERTRVSLPSSDLDVNFEANLPSYYHCASLDEIIEIGCDSPIHTKSQPRLLQLPQKDTDNVMNENVSPGVLMESVRNSTVDYLPSVNNTVFSHGLDNARGVVLTNGKANREAHKLSRLLEQCNLLQNVIDEKLSLYF
ncbi:SAC3 family protein B isoform X2 [Prosopis cineraria]|uniref:SAC3 family protein B isoform X2 n=1 Tax=Prosopis cineraria TaxID=364024 RepID=UPI00240F3EE6|nr:SAC3 family protein B isoform X2 [Prosopis cineraria]